MIVLQLKVALMYKIYGDVKYSVMNYAKKAKRLLAVECITLVTQTDYIFVPGGRAGYRRLRAD